MLKSAARTVTCGVGVSCRRGIPRPWRPGRCPVGSASADRGRQHRPPLGRRGSAHHRRVDEHRHAGDADRDRRPVGVVRHLRPARRRARCCACRTSPSTAATWPATLGPASRSSRRPPRPTRWPAVASRWPGVVEEPVGDERAAARDAHLSAVPAAKYYIDYSDFSLWVLRVDRVRWVGGYGRMDSTTRRRPTPRRSPTRSTPRRAGAIAHLNDDHADSLTAMARALGGYPDTTAADVHGRRPVRPGPAADDRTRAGLHPRRIRQAHRLHRRITLGRSRVDRRARQG